MAAKMVLPRVHALIVCDEAGPTTTNADVFDLHNVRTGIMAAAFPYTHPLLAVFVQVSGQEGKAAARLALIRADAEDDADPVVDTEREIDLFGPLTVVQDVFWVESCVFPQPGLYYFQVYFGSKLVFERPFLLTSDNQGTSNGRQQ
jgi:hypothetical protein